MDELDAIWSLFKTLAGVAVVVTFAAFIAGFIFGIFERCCT